jgi:hypothetical protein
VVTGPALADPAAATIEKTDIISMRFMTYSLPIFDETVPADRLRQPDGRILGMVKTARQARDILPIRQRQSLGRFAAASCQRTERTTKSRNARTFAGGTCRERWNT